ncbi:hypothetical protein [Rubritalea tangerina]
MRNSHCNSTHNIIGLSTSFDAIKLCCSGRKSDAFLRQRLILFSLT